MDGYGSNRGDRLNIMIDAGSEIFSDINVSNADQTEKQLESKSTVESKLDLNSDISMIENAAIKEKEKRNGNEQG